MKVLLVNGSPHVKGCTATALGEVAKALNECGIETKYRGLAASLFLAAWHVTIAKVHTSAPSIPTW